MTLGRGGSCRRDHHARHLLSVLGVGKAGAVHPSLALLRPHRPARRRPPAVWTGRLEVEQLRRSIAMLAGAAGEAVGREDALRLLAELGRCPEPPRRPQAAAAGAGGGGTAGWGGDTNTQ